MTSPHRVPVTLLYVNSDRPDRVRKAMATDADVVIVDLEDAVAPAAKTAARERLPELVKGSGRPVQVRVNALDTPWGRDDLAALDPSVGVRLPKVEEPETVRSVAGIVGAGRDVHCLLESALGLERAFEIAHASSSVASLGLGEEDLRSDLGVVDDGGLAWARSRVVVAARAAGLPAPAQSVYANTRDHEGLAASTRAGRRLGFVGRCAIHPAQLAVIRRATRPDDAEVRRASELLERLDHADSARRGVAVLEDGSFVDRAMVGAAERTLALAEATAE